MTDNELRTAILRLCKVASWDGDFNVVGFHSLCDKLKELGAAAEREACAKVCEQSDRYRGDYFAHKIRARGDK